MKTKKILKIHLPTANTYQQKCFSIYELLVENFSQTFFVGGFVRNLLLGHSITDIDITTAAKPQQIISVLKNNKFSLDLSALKYGVVKVRIKDKFLEITSFRTETYHGSRYPKIAHTNSLSKDSRRRDFTINSLYFHAKSKTVYDPQSGLSDLRARRLRLVGKPLARLKEDPLRVIRAFRFQSDYNLSLEKKTEEALDKFLEQHFRISRQKILKEIKAARLSSTKKYLQKLFLHS